MVPLQLVRGKGLEVEESAAGWRKVELYFWYPREVKFQKLSEEAL